MSELVHMEKDESQGSESLLTVSSVRVLEANENDKDKEELSRNVVRLHNKSGSPTEVKGECEHGKSVNNPIPDPDHAHNIKADKSETIDAYKEVTGKNKEVSREDEQKFFQQVDSSIPNSYVETKDDSLDKHKGETVAANNRNIDSNGIVRTSTEPSSLPSISDVSTFTLTCDAAEAKTINPVERVGETEKASNSHSRNGKLKVVKDFGAIQSQVVKLAKLVSRKAESGISGTLNMKPEEDSFACDCIEDLSEEICFALLDKMIKQVAFDVHRESRMEHIWLDDEEIAKERLDTKDIYHINKTFVSQLLCVCPNCGRKVGASRFAPHLEKCNQRSVRDRNRKVREKSIMENPLVTLKPLQFGREKKEKSLSSWTPGDKIPCWACGKVETPPTVICDGCDRLYHDSCLMKTDGGNEGNSEGESDGKDRNKDLLVPAAEMIPEACFCGRCLPNIQLVINSPRTNKRKRKLPMSNSKATEMKLENGRVPAPYEMLEFYCDICNKAIMDSRWRCLNCNNFDSCIECFEEKRPRTRSERGHTGKHPSYHHMVKIKISKSPDGGPTRH